MTADENLPTLEDEDHSLFKNSLQRAWCHWHCQLLSLMRDGQLSGQGQNTVGHCITAGRVVCAMQMKDFVVKCKCVSLVLSLSLSYMAFLWSKECFCILSSFILCYKFTLSGLSLLGPD